MSIPSNSNYQKLFVVGCPRSGTTWITKMLGSHPQIVKLPSESHLYKLVYDPFTYLKKLKLSVRLKKASWIFKHFGFKPILFGFHSNDIWNGMLRTYKLYQNANQVGIHICIDYEDFKEEIAKLKEASEDDLIKAQNLIAHILDMYFHQKGGNSEQILLEKTPMHIRYANSILAHFPEAKVLEVVRDVRDVCTSWKARSKTQCWARKSTEDVVQRWQKCIQWGDRIQAEPEFSHRIHRVKYENLRQSPVQQLKEIFDFLEVAYDEAQVHHIVDTWDISKEKNKGEGKHIRQGKIGDWQNSLSQEEIDVCEQLAAPMLAKLGYPVSSS
ncbi:sulfotransferase [Geitlerinema sp. PCC 9228]|uniref:sulfotransferase family protein n=1 Tax=Geitlerinema sp. PCC 9228 TaxID=111611 RepID=UPI0008F9CC20|nr:sulfotransferase [Geitlerinema sp. PCC 9228]